MDVITGMADLGGKTDTKRTDSHQRQLWRLLEVIERTSH